MKKAVYFLFLAALISCTRNAHRQAQTNENNPALRALDSVAIMENFNRQEACWNAKDLECYVQAYHLSDNVQTISKAGVTKGYNNILRDYQRYFPKNRMGKLHFDQIELKRLSEQYYYAVGRFNLNYETPDTLYQGWFSVLFEKKNGHWLMISDHSS